jgi:rhodanese-related sulfurtransferase
VLLDARQPSEYRVSHLRGARRIDPDHPDIEGLSVPRDARVVVYCAVGWRSGDVASRLQEAGYRQVYNLEGGIFGWANRGRPVYRDGERVRRVHPYDETWGRLLDRELHAYRP